MRCPVVSYSYVLFRIYIPTPPRDFIGSVLENKIRARLKGKVYRFDYSEKFNKDE